VNRVHDRTNVLTVNILRASWKLEHGYQLAKYAFIDIIYCAPFLNLHGRNDYWNIKIYLDTDLKIILLHYQNNYVECLNIDKIAKSFNILATSWNVLHNYFDDLNKIIFRSAWSS